MLGANEDTVESQKQQKEEEQDQYKMAIGNSENKVPDIVLDRKQHRYKTSRADKRDSQVTNIGETDRHSFNLRRHHRIKSVTSSQDEAGARDILMISPVSSSRKNSKVTSTKEM